MAIEIVFDETGNMLALNIREERTMDNVSRNPILAAIDEQAEANRKAGQEPVFPTPEDIAELDRVLDECAMAMTQGMIDALVKALQPDPWYVRLWNWMRR